MVGLTAKERECLILLFKDFATPYNANSISKVLGISHVGAQKMFRRMVRDNLVIGRKIGKSIVFKLNFEERYVDQLIAFLLADEANNFKRWSEEFKDLAKKDRILMIFGSAIKGYSQAQDIDVIIVMDGKDAKEVNEVLKKKEEMLPKRLHAIKMTRHDLTENLKKGNKAIVDIVKNAVVLYGQDRYLEIVKNVAGF